VLRPLEGLDHRGVADALRAAPIFLNFPIREGFPLPPLEAMACGCIVIGYSGRGGDEYLLPDCSFPVPEGDSIEYARVVETVIDEYTKKDERLAAISRAAIDLVSTEYTMDRQDREAVEVFTQLAPTPRAVTGASTKVPMASMLRDVHAHDPSRARVLAYHAREGLRTLTRRAHG
jgi:Glycosyl transferases group 1